MIPAAREASDSAGPPGSILELQAWRHTTVAEFKADHQSGIARLTNLNPRINAWFILELEWSDTRQRAIYHLENPDRRGTQVALGEPQDSGLLLESGQGSSRCELWGQAEQSPLEKARHTGLPFSPLCNDRLYLRNVVSGAYTPLERITDFLRDHVWGGDRIVTFVRKHAFQDRFAEEGGSQAGSASVAATVAPEAPRRGLVDSGRETQIVPEHLGIDIVGGAGRLAAGQWYEVNGLRGVYVSVLQPEAIAGPILSSFPRLVGRLDEVEAGAVDYMVAFDLTLFELGFALGTDHPRVDWSGRELDEMHDSSLSGPDGIATSAPLVRTGMVSPDVAARTIATFAGGFKREHGAFRYGELARQNHGSHYGFIEEGVLFSTLQPGLATVYVLNDGTVDIRTWTTAGTTLLPQIRFARQNGVPLIERSSSSPAGAEPGSLVSQWGAGNWSGSADERLRTLRAGI
ncbi:MAG TPA: hypothetical protein VLX90_02460, partial [Steroidobacteraceae bacterium]|nr:hypothetical protein [Steroidobacteraceae bacterium]